MKKNSITKALICLGLLTGTALSLAQTSTENYIQTKECLSADCIKKRETITYYDGLGRPKQVISVKVSPTGKDWVIPIKYDAHSRQSKEILPTPVSSLNSAFHSAIADESSANTYYGVTNAYSEKKLENSPFDRVLQQAHPGEAWKLNTGHTKSYEYRVNQDNEVRKFIATTTLNSSGGIITTVSTLAVSTENTIYASGGYYKANTLYKTTTTDEDGNLVIQYENGDGQVLLSRQTDGNQNIDTYYVYNDYDQLAFIIPPKAVTEIINNGNTITDATRDNLCYQYRYDLSQRLVEKKLPGKGWEYQVYDKQDRLVATQDANLRAQNHWMYTKYDQFGRVIMTGICIGMGTTRPEEQSFADTKGSNNETRGASVVMNYSGMDIYYSVQGYPQYDKVYNFLSLHYYDLYPTGAPVVPTQILGQDVLSQDSQNSAISTKGLPTASYFKNTAADDYAWTKNYNYFDSEGRQIGTHSINHLGGYTKKEYKLNYSGLTDESFTYHKRTASNAEVKVKERFVYDEQNRVIKQYHQVDNLQEELLSENTYNEIGELINKMTGNTSGTPLQSINYNYNIRGWLTAINNPNIGENFEGRLFGIEFKHHNPADSPGLEKFNGNISQVDWKTGNDNVLRRYTYQFDKMDRLTWAMYSKPEDAVPITMAYDESLLYDENGNIIHIARNGEIDDNQAVQIDALDLTYDGNKLVHVDDYSGNPSGYPDGGNDIQYDTNGNMKDHLDKGIIGITYSHLNLPMTVNMVGGAGTPGVGNLINFKYRADGTKIEKNTNYVNPGITDLTDINYLDGFQYERTYNGATDTGYLLQFIPTSEGYFDFQKKRYIYNYKDLVGNVRLSYYKDTLGNPVIDKETNYYPFGLEHSGYNSAISQLQTYRYGFQEQEKQKETGWSSFKWRNSIPELGRFFNVDPLAEDYETWSVYAFSGNRVVDAREIEGLEPARFNEKYDGLPRDEWEFGVMIRGGINSVRAAASNSVGRLMNTIAPIAEPHRNRYEVDNNGFLVLVTGVPRETAKQKVVNTAGDLTTLGLAAAGGPQGALMSQGTKPAYLKAFESVKQLQKAQARAMKLSQKPRPGKPFTKAGKAAVKDLNKIKNGGKTKCAKCKVETVPGKKSKKGVAPPKNETQIDHIDPESLGGSGTPNNGQVLCRDCNIKKSNKRE